MADRIRTDHALRPLRDWRPVWRAAACAGLGVAIVAGLARHRALSVELRPATAVQIGQVVAHGVWAGASVIAAADLRGTGQPLLVGTNAEAGWLWAVVWSIAADGSARRVGAVRLAHEVDVATRIIPGRYVPGPGQQVAILLPTGAGAEVYLVGWGAAGPVLLGASSLPGVSVGSAAVGPSGAGRADSLFAIGTGDLLERWAWAPAARRFNQAAKAPLQVPPGDLPQGLAAGQTGTTAYVAAYLDAEAPYPCSGGPAGLAEVFESTSLGRVWRGALAGQPVQGLGAHAPGGALVALADGSPGGAGARIETWDGSGWTATGWLPCGTRIIGTAPQDGADGAVWLAVDGAKLERIASTGQVVGSGTWPFQGDSPFIYYHRWPYVAIGSVVAFADFWRLETARWTDSSWMPVWQAADSATIEPTAAFPASGGWELLDAAGNVYKPAGASWTWAGQAPPDALVASWIPLAGGSYRPVISGTPRSRALTLLTTEGRVAYSGPLPPGDAAVAAIVPLPLNAHRVDVGVALAEDDGHGGPHVPLFVLRPSAQGTLRQVATLNLPVPASDAVVGAPYVLPGTGRAEIVFPFMSAAGAALGMHQQVAAVWTGRSLHSVSAPAAAGAVQGFATIIAGAGRWVAVGLVQGVAVDAGLQLGGAPSAYLPGPPDASSALLLGRLGAGNAPIWTRIPLPVQPPDGPVRALPIPDGSGRVLLTVSGQTFIYRVR